MSHLASRDTPYPDSPLGASTTAEHVASQQVAVAHLLGPKGLLQHNLLACTATHSNTI